MLLKLFGEVYSVIFSFVSLCSRVIKAGHRFLNVRNLWHQIHVCAQIMQVDKIFISANHHNYKVMLHWNGSFRTYSCWPKCFPEACWVKKLPLPLPWVDKPLFATVLLVQDDVAKGKVNSPHHFWTLENFVSFHLALYHQHVTLDPLIQIMDYAWI